MTLQDLCQNNWINTDPKGLADMLRQDFIEDREGPQCCVRQALTREAGQL